MRMLLVRHAETDANVNGTLQGHGSNPLSARGQRQATLISRRLMDLEIDVAYSSDLERARQTTLAIVQDRNISSYFDARLRERNYGVFQRRPVSAFQAAFESTGLSREEFRPDGGESYADVDIRSVAFLEEIIGKPPTR